MRLLVLAATFSALGACATPSERISDALVSYGLAPAQAECVGDQLQRNLSLGQLQELARLARTYREQDPNPAQLGTDDLIRVAGQVRDIRVPLEVGKAAANCGVVGSSRLGLAGAFLKV